VGATEYARPNTGARITHGNSVNGALPITGERITRGNNANSTLAIRARRRRKQKIAAQTVRA
jgi:hypothetical protein